MKPFKLLLVLFTISLVQQACASNVDTPVALDDDAEDTVPLVKEIDHPNIIFILADDYGWRDVGYNGEGFYETPNIDQISKDGITFTNNYSSGPNCAPARACLLSGMYTPRHHLYTPGGLSKGNVEYMKLKVPTKKQDATYGTFQSNDDEIDPEIISIAEVMNSAGYATARFGKWHIGDDKQGFDYSSSDGLVENKEAKHYGDINVADQLTDGGLKFIEDHKDEPFFVFISHWDVHTPIRAKQEVIDKFDAKLALTGGDWNTTYAAMIEAVDKSVGNVRAKIEELGLAENTIIIFTTDNGGQPHITSNNPLKGGKGSLFEGGIRVPGCAVWPGTISAGIQCDVPIISVDFLPTFAELGGADLPKTQAVDGVSIVPLLKGESSIGRASIFWFYPLYLSGNTNNKVLPIYGTDTYYWRGVPSCAVRKGDWKLIYYFEDESVKLFNIIDDLGEENECSVQNPEKADELLSEIKAWLIKTEAPIPSVLNPAFVQQ